MLSCLCWSDSTAIDEKTDKNIKSELNIVKCETNNVSSVKTETTVKHLICDDSEPNRMVLEKYLTRKFVKIDIAKNGSDAIDMVRQYGEYAIIWMDIQMPKMTGYESTKILRNELHYKGIIIGLTGYIDQESVNKCIGFGMNHVIGKPINKDKLYFYVDKYNTTNKMHVN